MKNLRRMLSLMAVAFASCASAQTPATTAQQASFNAASGYLPMGSAPDSTLLVPPPPAPGSGAQARDDAEAQLAIALRGSPRWDQAIRDADLGSLNQSFACALGVELSPTNAPRLTSLLRRTMADLGRATFGAKRKYQRQRPFMVNAAPLCTPEMESVLRQDGSYPSGHSAIGWGLALVLTEAAPERANLLLARGRAFGQSRVICNAHWLSDAEEGRVIAAATVAELHTVPEFRSDLDAARAEIEAAKAAGRRPALDKCAKEQEALDGGSSASRASLAAPAG
jgi:acid phosphatase (class A)